MSNHPAVSSESELLAACDVRRQRRSGPGGQHRNKVETAIFVEHRPTGVQAEASERRSQEENRKIALFRLRVKLAVEVRGELADLAPSEMWLGRLRGTKIQLNAKHDDFPSLLAEALDVITAFDFALPMAAERLRTSSSQLVGLLSDEPTALQLVNRRREELGLGALRRR